MMQKTLEANLAVNNPLATLNQDTMISEITKFTNHSIIQTPKVSAAQVDGFFIKGGEITGIFELKYWQDTPNSQKRIQSGVWFTDAYKIETLCNLSKQLCVPSYLFGGYKNTIYVFNIANKKGSILIPVCSKTITMNNTTFGNDKKQVQRNIVEFALNKAKIINL